MGLINLFIHLADVEHATPSATTFSTGGAKTWANLISDLKCRIEPLSAQERLQSQAEGKYRTHRLYCFPADVTAVTEADRVLFDSRYFDIVAINDWRDRLKRIDLLELPQAETDRVEVVPWEHLGWSSLNGPGGALWFGFATSTLYLTALFAELQALGFRYLLISSVGSIRDAHPTLGSLFPTVVALAATYNVKLYIVGRNEMFYAQTDLNPPFLDGIPGGESDIDKLYALDMVASGVCVGGLIADDQTNDSTKEQWRTDAATYLAGLYQLAVSTTTATVAYYASLDLPYPDIVCGQFYGMDDADFTTELALRVAAAAGRLATDGQTFQAVEDYEGVLTYDRMVEVHAAGFRGPYLAFPGTSCNWVGGAGWETALWDPDTLASTQDFEQSRTDTLRELVRFNSDYGKFT